MPVVRGPTAATVWAILVYDDADFVTRGRVPNSTTVPGLTPLLNASQLYMDFAKCVSQVLAEKGRSQVAPCYFWYNGLVCPVANGQQHAV
jgi:hypothetical protein